MIKKLGYATFLILCSILAFFILWLASDPFAKAQQQPLICDTTVSVLENLATRFGEISTEQGRDGEIFMVITVNPLHQWTMIVTPKGQPNIFCVVATGHSWTQEEASSTGIIDNGSIIIFSFKEAGEWSLVHINNSSKEISNVTTTGYDWKRTVILKN